MTPRLKKSIEEMATFCRDLLYEPNPSGIGGSWAGPITPLRSVELLWELLDDIHHNRPVYTAAGGELRHLSTCQARHCRHDWMNRVRPEELLRTFKIRLYYTGGREDPRCWVKGIDRANGRHMWTDDSICPFMSSRDAWDWTRQTVADFVGHVSIWLVSWMVFQQAGVWIVGEHGNTPQYHHSRIKPHHLCWCRSGKKYRKCHMHEDERAVFRLGGEGNWQTLGNTQ